MKSFKRIAAWIGILILIGMYIITLILGLTANESTKGWLMASIACTIVVPCLLYGMMLLARILDHRDLTNTMPTDDTKPASKKK